MDDKNPNLRNNIREFRAKDRLTQEDLAKKVGVTRQTIIAIEKGDYVPSLLLGLRIARAFNTPVEVLFTIHPER